MARKLSNKTNVEAPAGSYPYGRIKDNPGDNTGTPVNEEVYGDMHQFFEKLMDATGTTFNNQPENQTAGFQFYNALIAAIRATAASQSAKGTVEIASQTEVNTGTDTARVVTPATLQGRTATTTRSGVAEIASQTEVNTGTDNERFVTPATLAAKTATETRTGVAEIASQAEVDGGTDDARIITPSKLKNATAVIVANALATDSVTTIKIASGAVTLAKMAANSVGTTQLIDGSVTDAKLATSRVKIASGTGQKVSKRLTIPAWNMYDSGAALHGFIIAHGLTSAQWKTATVDSIVVRNDANTKRAQLTVLKYTDGEDDGTWFDATNLNYTSYNGTPNNGDWDGTGFDRGYVDISYIE